MLTYPLNQVEAEKRSWHDELLDKRFLFALNGAMAELAGMMSMALARGWALAITDYQGLGTPGDHTYMVGRALGA